MGDVFTYSFRMQLDDFMALRNVLRGRSFWSPILILALYFGAVAGLLLAGVDGDPAAFTEVLRQVGAGSAPVWVYPLLLLGPLLLALWPLYRRVLVAHAYWRTVTADRELVYRMNSDAIQGGIPDVQGRFAWSAIRRIVVTPTHAFLTLSRRDALIIPRRAVATDEDFDTLLAFARARITAARAGYA